MIEDEKKRKTRRRGRGEGTITARKDGRWEARITVAPGKRRTFYGRTREAVRDQLQHAMSLQGRGLLVRKSMTLAQWADLWLEEHVTGLRPRHRRSIDARILGRGCRAAQRSYRQILRDHVLPPLGGHRLDKLTVAIVHTWYVQLRKRTSTRTASLAHATLRACLGRAVRLDLAARNVAGLISPVRPTRATITVLDVPQAKALLATAAGHPYEALFAVALANGLRLGEALGLHWTDIDLDGEKLAVRRQLQLVRRPGQAAATLQDVPVKSTHGDRVVPLPGFAVSALRAHRQRHYEARLRAGEDWQSTAYVFTTPIGRPIDPSNLRRAFKALLRSAELPAFRFHDLRHSCASLLLAQGVPPHEVQARLGHSDIRVTLTTYAHILPGLQRRSADELQRPLG